MARGPPGAASGVPGAAAPAPAPGTAGAAAPEAFAFFCAVRARNLSTMRRYTASYSAVPGSAPLNTPLSFTRSRKRAKPGSPGNHAQTPNKGSVSDADNGAVEPARTFDVFKPGRLNRGHHMQRVWQSGERVAENGQPIHQASTHAPGQQSRPRRLFASHGPAAEALLPRTGRTRACHVFHSAQRQGGCV